jgi:hypothetical protein
MQIPYHPSPRAIQAPLINQPPHSPKADKNTKVKACKTESACDNEESSNSTTVKSAIKQQIQESNAKQPVRQAAGVKKEYLKRHEYQRTAKAVDTRLTSFCLQLLTAYEKDQVNGIRQTWTEFTGSMDLKRVGFNPEQHSAVTWDGFIRKNLRCTPDEFI